MVGERQRLQSGLRSFGPPIYSALLLAAAIISRVAILSNDSFPLRWQAEHLSLADPASFYNGFFPIGYPLLMRVASMVGNPFVVLEVVQIVLAFFLFRALARFMQSYASTGWSIALAATLLYP